MKRITNPIRKLISKILLWFSLWFELSAIWIHPNKVLQTHPELILRGVLAQLKDKFPEHYSDFEIVKKEFDD